MERCSTCLLQSVARFGMGGMTASAACAVGQRGEVEQRWRKSGGRILARAALWACTRDVLVDSSRRQRARQRGCRVGLAEI
jgi:hypothetical protein